MSDYLIYGSEQYAALRQGPGVLVRQLATNATQWLQGDEANDLEAAIEGAARRGGVDSEITERTDYRISQYFGNEGVS